MNNIWNSFKENRKILENEFKNPVFSNGVSLDELTENCRKIAGQKEKSRVKIKSEIVCYVLENAQISVLPQGRFPDKLNHGDIFLQIRNDWLDEVKQNEMADILKKNENAVTYRAFTGECDFGHCAPDWENVLSLGIPGIINRLDYSKNSLKEKGLLSQKKAEFFETCTDVYKSLIVYIKRNALMAKQFEKDEPAMALLSKSLLNLTENKPENIYEAMLIMNIFYYVQTFVECDLCRSLGCLDRLLSEFYFNDLKNGTFTKEQIKDLFRYFMIHFYAENITANLPFTLCGLDKNGNEVTNELTYLILDAYDELSIISPKIHIRCSDKTPNEILEKVCGMIKRGNSSFVFANDEIIIKSLMALGETEQEAKNYILVGCYEPAALGKEVPCSCNGQINLLKAVEYALTSGKDILSGAKNGCDTKNAENILDFNEFLCEVKKQISFLANRSMEQISEYEKHYMKINPSPLFSATIDECVATATDVYSGGAKYNNSSICGLGLANAADSLYTIKRLVFEEKQLTLKELVYILINDWKGFEKLRLKIKTKLPKYGNGNETVDLLAKELTDYTSQVINYKPNGRGGKFRTSYFSIDWRAYFGKFTAASADGRMCGETLSKNISASLGCDKSGVTGLVKTASMLDYVTMPNGTVLDIVLHHTAVSGQSGEKALLSLIKTYFNCGGMLIHCNVLDPSVLRKAQKHPDEYSNLQIRLCGWNVYFVDLSETEQNEFIIQAENG